MDDNREEKKIVIEGRTFVAERLHPNYKGEYDCTCEECALGEHCYRDDKIGWYANCLKVKCIGHDRASENFNVWSEQRKEESV